MRNGVDQVSINGIITHTLIAKHAVTDLVAKVTEATKKMCIVNTNIIKATVEHVGTIRMNQLTTEPHTALSVVNEHVKIKHCFSQLVSEPTAS